MSNISHHNWYEEDFVSFLLSLNLPAYRKNTSIETILSTEKKSFTSKFKKMFFQQRFRIFSATFYDTLSVQLPKIKQNFDRLHKILNSYNNADMSAAQTQFNDLMSNLKENLFIQNIYWPQRDGNFYRVRASTNEKLSKPEDLFHIPYSKRHLASNERYSMAGHPSFYPHAKLLPHGL